MDIPALRFVKTFGFGESDGGNWLVIEGEDQNGQRLTFRIPFTLEAEFLAKFQGAAGTAAKARGDKLSEKITNAMNPENIGIGVTSDRKIGLRMKMKAGTTLDLVMDDEMVGQLRQALAELDKYQKTGGPSQAQ